MINFILPFLPKRDKPDPIEKDRAVVARIYADFKFAVQTQCSCYEEVLDKADLAIERVRQEVSDTTIKEEACLRFQEAKGILRLQFEPPTTGDTNEEAD